LEFFSAAKELGEIFDTNQVILHSPAWFSSCYSTFHSFLQLAQSR